MAAIADAEERKKNKKKKGTDKMVRLAAGKFKKKRNMKKVKEKQKKEKKEKPEKFQSLVEQIMNKRRIEEKTAR